MGFFSIFAVVLRVSGLELLVSNELKAKQASVSHEENHGDSKRQLMLRRLTPPAGVSAGGHMEDRGNCQCNGRERQRCSRSARGSLVEALLPKFYAASENRSSEHEQDIADDRACD